MSDDYRLHLNILPVVGEIPTIKVFRRRCTSPQEERPNASALSYRVREVVGGVERDQAFWFLAEPAEGFELFECDVFYKPSLTQQLLFRSLRAAVTARLKANEYWLPKSEFRPELALIMKQHPQGHEELIVEPYFLRSAGQFGFVVDFHFRKNPQVAFDRKVQQLSLSLNKDFRRNTDHYLDRSKRIRQFVEARAAVFDGIILPGHQTPVNVSRDFVDLPADRLRSKTYVFAAGKESRSQFNGLREHGPLTQVPSKPRLLFVFRGGSAIRSHARWGGREESFAFPGFQAVFKTPVDIDAIPSCFAVLRPEMDSALAKVKERQAVDRAFCP